MRVLNSARHGCDAAAKVNGKPQFPYENHSLASVVAIGRTNNLVSEFGAVSFPPTKWVSNKVDSVAAKWVGASSLQTIFRVIKTENPA